MPEVIEPTHVIDPDGEVVILLHGANAPFAPCNVDEKISSVEGEFVRKESNMLVLKLLD
jgi:hypothetical protein